MRNKMNRTREFGVISVIGISAAMVVASATPAAAQTARVQYGRGDRRVEGERLTTMRALAHRLDDAAETAARAAGDTSLERTGAARQRFLWAINDFARQARSLHERMDRYDVSPWDVADEVAALNTRATAVSTQIRAARAFPDTYNDWAEAQKALALMTSVLHGQQVSLPPIDRRGYQPFEEGYTYRDGRHWPGPGDNSHDGYLAGKDMIEFRRLAEALTVEVGRLTASVRASANIADRTNRPLADLRYFAQRAEDLNRTSSADVLNARDVAPTIDRMLEDGRQYQTNMRASNDFPNSDWAPALRVLEQMAAIARAQ